MELLETTSHAGEGPSHLLAELHFVHFCALLFPWTPQLVLDVAPVVPEHLRHHRSRVFVQSQSFRAHHPGHDCLARRVAPGLIDPHGALGTLDKVGSDGLAEHETS